MGGALDQASAGVEKLIRLPFKRHAAVWAAIAVDEYLSFSAHGYQLQPVNLKASAVRFSQVLCVAEEFHALFPSDGQCRAVSQVPMPDAAFPASRSAHLVRIYPMRWADPMRGASSDLE
jgi:hypothetical protein